MAEREIARIAEEARSRWSAAVAVQHRVGRVAVGEASLVVACGTRHRRDGFEAIQWIVDRIKELAPIWKTGFEARDGTLSRPHEPFSSCCGSKRPEDSSA
jgi:molybdopterin synthase catalytic subunit